MEIKDPLSPFLEATLILYKKVFPESYEISIEEVKIFLLSGLYRIFISLKSNKVVAGAIISDIIPKNPHVCHLDYVFVNPEVQGKGIGTNFINEVINFLKEEGKNKTMTLECYSEMISFYKKFGAYSSISPSQMGDHKKLFNFMAIPIQKDHKLSSKEMNSILFSIRSLHHEELDQNLEDKFIWKSPFEITQCK